MSVARAQAEIDSREFAEWIAFGELEPFGPERDDLRSAIVASTVANANRGRGQRAFTPADFMPRFAGAADSKQQSVAEMQHRIKMAFKGMKHGNR